MNKQQINKKITKLIIDCCELDDIKSLDDISGLSLIDDMKFDSLSFMSLIIGLEKEFHIEFDDMELLLENFDNCDKLIEYVVQLVFNQVEVNC